MTTQSALCVRPPGIETSVERRLADARELERLGRHGEARACFEELLRALPLDASVPHSAAALLRWVGTTHRAEGDVGAALDCYEASLASAEAAGSAVDCASALNWLGVIAQEQGHADQAVAHYSQARDLAQRSGSGRLTALVVHNLGVMACIQGDLASARDHYSSSLDIVRALDDHAATAAMLNNLGILHMQLDQWDAAAAAFDECEHVSDAVGELHLRAMVEVNRVELHYRRGDRDHAMRHCHRARQLALQVEHHVALGEAYRWYGTLKRELRRFESAEAYFAAALEVADRFGKSLLAAEVQRELALLFREQDRNHEALQALSRAHAVFSDLRATPLLHDVEGTLRELEAIYLDVVQRWSESIEQKDLYTSGHCQRVAEYACQLAHRAGLDDITLTWFRMGALLHDVGKIAIPAEVLNKPGSLTAEERAIIERHTVIGDEMLASMSFPWDIRPMVRGHHERWDGTGYPDRLSGPDIPVAARILCIADVFDALTTDRPYRPGFSHNAAVGLMRADAGRMFDPQLFALFESDLGTD